jgi:fused signal recognition particle receptor
MRAAMAEQPRKSLFDKLKRGLFMTHTEIIEKVRESMTPELPIDKSAIDGLEEGLLGADVGAELTMSLVDRIEQRIRAERITRMDRFTEVLREETRGLIPQRQVSTIDVARAKPFVILVVGVNGTGKTTTIAKLASRFRSEGKSVLLGAADTFRAAAIEQLQLWGIPSASIWSSTRPDRIPGRSRTTQSPPPKRAALTSCLSIPPDVCTTSPT